MIQAPIEVDQDPEPDIRRFSSSSINNPQGPNNPPSTALSPASQHTHHGVPNSRIDRSPHPPSIIRSDYDEKHAGDYDVRSASDLNPTPPSGDKHDKIESDVPVSRSSSKKPKVRDFAVSSLTVPIRRATEKLVPTRRNGSPEVAFALPPDRPGTPRQRPRRAQPKLLSATPGWKVSFKVSIVESGGDGARMHADL